MNSENNSELNGEKRNEGSASDGQMQLMNSSEKTTEKILMVQQNKTPEELEESPGEGLIPRSSNLDEEISDTMLSIDSTANDLQSYMRGMFGNEPEPEIKSYNIDKVQTAVVIGKQINELMRTKIEAIKTFHEIYGEE